MACTMTTASAISSLPLSTNHMASTPPPESAFEVSMDNASLKSNSGNVYPQPARSSIQQPMLSSRKSSGANLVHRDHPSATIRKHSYPASDARSMSPRRSNAETEKLGRDMRRTIQEHAKSLQSGLAALAEKIEIVKMDHDKLEKQNLLLQDYIGGLTRSMSRTDISSSKVKK